MNKKFSKLQQCEGGSVKFGNNDGAKICEKCTVQIMANNIRSDDVLYVSGLRHNLLSVSQICDKGHEVIFTKNGLLLRSVAAAKLLPLGPGLLEISTHCRTSLRRHV